MGDGFDLPKVKLDSTQAQQTGEGPRIVADTTGTPPPQPPPEVPTWMKSALTTLATSIPLFNDLVASQHFRKGPDRNVVRAQVVATYRQYYMSDAARTALVAGKKLPLGDAMINTPNLAEVNKITNDVIAAYEERIQTVEGRGQMTASWERQVVVQGFVTEGGVPNDLILERSHVVWESDPALSGEARMSVFAREAESRLADTHTYRNGLREMMRRIGR